MIKLAPFSGIAPRTGVRLLPNTGAQIAANVQFESGELRPLHSPASVSVPTSPKTLPPLSIFRARTGTSDAAWFTWPIDVDCVRVPLSTDVESRFCWTGDGPPKLATYSNATSGGNNNYPLLANELSLGIPTPQTLPGVTPSGGSATDVTRFYCYTFFSALGEESAPSPVSLSTTGKPDGTWAIANMDTAPTNSGTGTAAYGSVTTFTNAASAKHWLQVGDEVYFTSGVGIVTTLVHTVASVPSASTFTVTGDYGAATAWSRKTAWNTVGMVKRLYRTVGTAATFQLVADNIAVATTTYNDTLSDTLIPGDDLISTGWVPPPTSLQGLGVHSSGALFGFVNNLLCFSEPLQPHAWPVAYQLAAGGTGVGAASYGSTVVLATKGSPFIATGVEPVSMTGEDVPGVYPCLAKRSVIGFGDSVLYSSAHGMVQVGAQGLNIFTAPFYTRVEWALLDPTSIVAATAGGHLYLAYTDTDAARGMLVIDPGRGLVTVSLTVDELFADPGTGELYIGTDEGVLHWDDLGESVLTGDWKSKEFVFPAPVNLGAAKIDYVLTVNPADIAVTDAAIAAATAANTIVVATGNVGGAVNGSYIDELTINGDDLTVVPDELTANNVTFNLYSGETLVASRVVTDNKVFRLPSGYKRDAFSVEVITTCRIREIRVGETPNELRQA